MTGESNLSSGIQKLAAHVDEPLVIPHAHKSDYVIPKVGIMCDIESLALGVRPVITQIAFYSFSMDDPETIVRHVWNYLPIQPQLELLPPRVIQAKTIGWWLQQSDEARRKMLESMDGDFTDLQALLRHTVREFGFMVEGLKPGEYELIARGPQFDIAAFETLLQECGVEVPWGYATIRDLRTKMSDAMITTNDVAKPDGFISHQAGWDCIYQIKCWAEANRLLGAAR